MSDKAKEILASIADSVDKLDDTSKAFLEGYITRAVQESGNRQAEDRKADSKEEE